MQDTPTFLNSFHSKDHWIYCNVNYFKIIWDIINITSIINITREKKIICMIQLIFEPIPKLILCWNWTNPKTNFVPTSVRVPGLFFEIRSSIDNPDYDIVRSNFEYWDHLIVNSA